MAVELWTHQCTVTGKEEKNFQGQSCPHCGAEQPAPPAPPTPQPTQS